MNDWNIEAEFVDDNLVVTMPQKDYEEIEDMFFSRFGITLESAIKQFIMWTVNSPHEFRKWMREASEHNTYQEREKKDEL